MGDDAVLLHPHDPDDGHVDGADIFIVKFGLTLCLARDERPLILVNDCLTLGWHVSNVAVESVR